MRAEQESWHDSSKDDVLPPHDLDAEEGVLGCILMEPAGCLPDCTEQRVRGEWFYHLPLRTLYAALQDMHTAETPIDLITLQKKLKDEGKLEGVGGLAYVASLPDKVPAATNLPHYIAILREKWLMRKLNSICSHTMKMIREKPGTFAETLAKTEEDILLLNTQRVVSKDASWREHVLAVQDQIENYQRGEPQMRGLSTGFPYLDKMCCGFAPSQLILVVGRPGDGKTSLGMNFVEHIAVDKGVPTGVFSLEMTSEDLCARALFQKAQADFQRFRTGYMLNDDLPKLTKVAAKVANAPILLDDNGDSTIDDICAKARRWYRENGMRAMLVDYVALVETEEHFREARDKIAYISKRLKRLAKALRIPVIVLVQLNRESEKAGGRVPLLSDLADSDQLGRDADLVMILYKPKIDMDDERPESEANAVRASTGDKDWSNTFTRINGQVAKQRNGPTGKIEFLFHKASMRFVPFHRNIREPVLEKKDNSRLLMQD